MMKSEPIAIIGIGCRFPQANSPEAFWQLLRNGVDAITEVPQDRWDLQRFYHPDPTQPDKTNSRWGGFLDQVDQFDPQFFGIAPREAHTIDPQQRLMLEVAWEALEDAGQVPAALAGSDTGVFVGIGTHDYSVLLWQHPVNDPYGTTGTGNCIAANRISYALDLRGPSMAIDTACSSSLVSVQMACQSLWLGESSLALAGGVNVLLLPTAMVGFTKSGLMAADGRCKTFDASADGYVRSEGAGMVVLKPLKQAKRDGDRIYAVIRGGAVNQDGRSNGLTAPNPQAQEAVLRQAYGRSGVSPGLVQYVEVHGTGTKLGDPMELKALGKVLADDRELGEVCAVGSVKTNIGHTETAAGIAGLIKVALAMHHGELPPSLHFQQPNPLIDFAKLGLRVQTETTPWVGEKFAGVSAFGFGGTNAHMVLQSAPRVSTQRSGKSRQPQSNSSPLPYLFTLSAKSELALKEMAAQYQAFLRPDICLADICLADICLTVNQGRSQFPYRLALIANSVEDLRTQLQEFVNGAGESIWTGHVTRKGSAAALDGQLSRLDSRLELLQQAATGFVQGEAIDWAALNQDGRKMALPTYPFQRQRYWAENARVADPLPPQVHPLLGQKLDVAGEGGDSRSGRRCQRFQGRFQGKLQRDSYLQDHCVFGKAIVPATAYLEMMLAASDDSELQSFKIETPLILEPSKTVQVTVVDNTVRIFSLNEDKTWTLQASGAIASPSAFQPSASRPETLEDCQVACPEIVSIAEFYQQLRSQGLEYGRSFRGVQQLWKGEGQAIAQIRLPKDISTDHYRIHPALLDACLQPLGAVLTETYLPVGCDRFSLYQSPGHELWSFVQIKSVTAQRVEADIWVWNSDGMAVAEMTGLVLRSKSLRMGDLGGGSPESAVSPNATELTNSLYQMVWQPQPIALQAERTEQNWIIFADGNGLGIALAEALKQKGDRCQLISFTDPLPPIPPQSNVIYLRGLTQPHSQPHAEASLCTDVLTLIQSGTLDRLWLVTQQTQAIAPHLTQLSGSTLWGLARVIRLEYPELICIAVDLEQTDQPTQCSLLQQELATDTEDQIAYRGGDRYVARLLPHHPIALPASPYSLTRSGNTLDQLQLISVAPGAIAPHQVEIQVKAVGVNFRDVLNALGMLDGTDAVIPGMMPDIPFGGECAGVVTAVGEDVEHLKVGDAVMAVQAIGCMGSHVVVDGRFVVPQPKGMSMVEAATIPVAFLTAYYGLRVLANLQPGDRVLIHSAAGGVGQAAVQIAQAIGAEIYATASPGKWPMLKEQGIQHVFSSRNLEFADVMPQVDVVLNSLNGEFISRSMALLAIGGRFVEIGKIGIWTAAQVQKTRSDISYYTFDLLDLSQQKPDLITDLLNEVVPEFQQGLQPLPHQVFEIANVAEAFRYMAQAKHRGKVVVTVPTPFAIAPEGCYLITGGVGALGLEAARWLVAKGAKHLALTWHRQVSPGAKTTITQWQKSGITIDLLQIDVAEGRSLAAIRALPHLRGVIHAAGMLDDGALAKLDGARMERVMAAKVSGAWNLHELTADLPLDFFVCFSSAASLLGSPGQGNYAAANAFLDGLAHYRRQQGLAGLSVNWGAWSIGMATARVRGMGAIAPAAGFEILEQLLAQNATQVGVLPVDWQQLGLAGRQTVFLDQILDPVLDIESNQDTKTIAAPFNQPDLTQQIRGQIAKILGFATIEKVAIDQKFDDMGMDSLMAVELSNYIRTLLGSSVPLDVAFDYPTVESLVAFLTQQGSGAVAYEANGNGNGNAKNGASSQPANIPEGFYNFERSPEYLHMRSYLNEVGRTGNTFFTLHEGVAGDTIATHGRELINYSSYNYLGFSGDAQVNAATKAAIDHYGTSVSASRVVSGERPLHQELEQALADWVGAEDAIVYVGGHTTNTTTIGHLFGQNDLILYDALSHNSIRQGCVLSGATAIEFPHNDWRSLDRLLTQQRHHYEKVLIAIEGIYSTDGDIAPLPEMVQVKTRHRAFLLVDEAHSIGVLGAQGRGIGEHFGVAGDRVDLWMGTLSKSFASCGGYIAGCRALVEYLKYTAPGFVFSVGMSPPNTASALAALRRLQAEPQRVAILRDRADLFLQLAKAQGFNTGMSQDSPVIPIIVGEAEKAIALSQRLTRRGINAQPMIHPSVPLNGARLRFFISCLHTEAQIRFTVETLAEEMEQLNENINELAL